MNPSTEIAEAIGEPYLILIYVVIVGLLAIIMTLIGKLHIDGKTIRTLAEGFAKSNENSENMSRLLHSIVARGSNGGFRQNH